MKRKIKKSWLDRPPSFSYIFVVSICAGIFTYFLISAIPFLVEYLVKYSLQLVLGTMMFIVGVVAGLLAKAE